MPADVSGERQRLARISRRERALWHDGVRFIAGVDEVGAGCLAGPVLAAAVVIAPGWCVSGVDDSKALSASQRSALAPKIKETAIAWAIGAASVSEIDEKNILQARLLAMKRAVLALGVRPDHVLVDGDRPILGITADQSAIRSGDALCISIAAASIVAKVTRDSLMARLDLKHPGYGFGVHKGYPTPQHRAALRRLGPCALHRLTFAPVAEFSGRSRVPA